uniref:Uncharacterized protein LOC114327920 n=1 Tax=Diabrotica virgifera virgifera TaxID=50390 RepID=A0A6P7FNA6_DIAVI
MSKDADNFSTPNNKRSRSEVSPLCQSNMAMINREELKSVLEESLDAKLNPRLDTIEIKLNNVATKEDINSLRAEISSLRRENNELKERVLLLESQVANFADMLGMQEEIRVNRAHPLGPSRLNGPIIAHIPWDDDIALVFKNIKKLKNTRIYVDRDYTKEVRWKRATLRKVMKKIKEQNSEIMVKLVFDKLLIESVRYSWDDQLGLMCGTENGPEKLLKDWNISLNLNMDTKQQVEDTIQMESGEGSVKKAGRVI